MARNQVPVTPPTFSTQDWAAQVRLAWGDAWHKKEVAYEFSDGRKFVDPGAQGGPYTGTGGNS